MNKELKPVCDVRCKKCYGHKIIAEMVEDIDGLAIFLVCIECGFDWEAYEGELC